MYEYELSNDFAIDTTWSPIQNQNGIVTINKKHILW